MWGLNTKLWLEKHVLYNPNSLKYYYLYKKGFLFNFYHLFVKFYSYKRLQTLISNFHWQDFVKTQNFDGCDVIVT